VADRMSVAGALRVVGGREAQEEREGPSWRS
jgi:hypothetical protein